jgi:tripartite-type tricarboxylate transporter receptor subunit TctC
MKLPRRKFLHLAAGAAALPAVSRTARAQTYPTRPVRIVVGFSPGGPNDIYARLIGQWLSERLGQQFVIDNRPGAASNIATEAVVRAPPDGYTRRGKMIQHTLPTPGLGSDLGEPYRGFRRLNLTEERADTAELVLSPML